MYLNVALLENDWLGLKNSKINAIINRLELKFTCGFFCIFVAKVSGIVHAYLLPHTKEESKDYFHKKYKKRQGCESVQMTSESACIWLIG